MTQLLADLLRRNGSIVLVFGLTIVTFAVVAALVPGFGSSQNITNVFLKATVLAIVAAGQTLVIISGGIDLSVPWMMTTGAVLTAFISNGADDQLALALGVVVSVAIVVGLVNGLGVTLLRVPPIIMTLAMNVLLSGLLSLIVGVAPPSKTPPMIRFLAHGEIAGVPAHFFVLAAVATAMTVLLSATPFGRRLYSVGTSVTASRFAGIRPARVIITAYIASALLAAAAGVFLIGYVGTSYLGLGEPYQFASIAAVVVGGASILGGSGHYIGTLAGALMLTVATGLLTVFSLGAGAISVFYGLIILISVWLASQRGGRLLGGR